MVHHPRAHLRFAALGLVGVALMGCQSVREAAGLTKAGPDEFAVVTKQPLIIPPDYNLRPPRDGAPPTNQVAPTDAAQSALFDTDPASAAKLIAGDYSDSEKMLLAQTGAMSADPSIRQQIASDGRAMEAADDSFTQKVLFWQDAKTPGDPVDADSEDRRLAQKKTSGQAGGVAMPKQDSATIQAGDDDSRKSDNSSWWPF
jgi:hypothetical protein